MSMKELIHSGILCSGNDITILIESLNLRHNWHFSVLVKLRHRLLRVSICDLLKVRKLFHSHFLECLFSVSDSHLSSTNNILCLLQLLFLTRCFGNDVCFRTIYHILCCFEGSFRFLKCLIGDSSRNGCHLLLNSLCIFLIDIFCDWLDCLLNFSLEATKIYSLSWHLVISLLLLLILHGFFT